MSSVAATSSASEIQMDYMTLLVTQLQNQNPLEPLDNNEMAAQLAQFSQLEQLESMNRSFADVLIDMKREYAASLIGKEISFSADNGAGAEELTTGVVEQVINNIDGETVVVTGNHVVSVNDIISVKS
jgi:flagellar basal-body rod modification protein FlgD